MSINKVKNIFYILLGALIYPSLAGAQVTIQSIVTSIENTVLYLASAITVILWIVTGLLFLMAQGAPEGVNKAKKAMFAAIAGTVIVIIAGSAIALVGQALGIP